VGSGHEQGMKAVVQRVANAKVVVGDKVTGQIDAGLLIFLGVGHDDDKEDVIWLTRKLSDMRLFADGEGKMNLSVRDLGLGCLVVSQFTLHASTKKGNRPSFINSAAPEMAENLYGEFISMLKEQINGPVEAGIFGAYMQVHFINDGPVTIIIDTKNKE